MLVAQHRVCVLFTATWVVIPKLDLESELELDSIESQDLFLELVTDSGFLFLHKGFSLNARGMAFRDIHLPTIQEATDYPWRSVEDKLLPLLFFKHLQNLLQVVLDCTNRLLMRQLVKLLQDYVTLTVLPPERCAWKSIYFWKQ